MANDQVSPARKEFEKWCAPDSPKEFEPGYWRCWQAAWEASCSQTVARVSPDELRGYEQTDDEAPAMSTPLQIAQHAKFDIETLNAIRMRADEGNPIHWSDFLYALHGLRAVPTPRCPRPERCECGHAWHGNEPCTWRGTEEGMELVCTCPEAYAVLGDEHFQKES